MDKTTFNWYETHFFHLIEYITQHLSYLSFEEKNFSTYMNKFQPKRDKNIYKDFLWNIHFEPSIRNLPQPFKVSIDKIMYAVEDSPLRLFNINYTMKKGFDYYQEIDPHFQGKDLLPWLLKKGHSRHREIELRWNFLDEDGRAKIREEIAEKYYNEIQVMKVMLEPAFYNFREDINEYILNLVNKYEQIHPFDQKKFFRQKEREFYIENLKRGVRLNIL